ncbi:MAG: FIST N-terminal domain-containing protein [Acidobacteriota bacterium]
MGQSTRLDTAQAAAEAADQALRRSGARRADLTLLFATASHAPRYEEMVRLVRDVTRARALVGCSGLGIMTTAAEIESSAGVAVMVISDEDLQVAPFLVHGLRVDPREAGREIGRQVKGALQPGSLLVLFPDTFPLNADAFFEGIRSEAGHIPSVGGSAAGDPNLGSSFQFCGAEIASDAVAGVLVSGRFEFSVEVTQACQPVGAPRVVTRAERNRIIEFEGRRALDVVVDLLGPVLRDNLEQAGRFLFFGLPVDEEQHEFKRGEFLIRSLIGIDVAAGALILPQPILQGQMLQILLREPDGARQDLKNMLDAQTLRQHGRVPRLGLYFNCCARGMSLYGIPEIDLNYIKYAFGELPLVGFSGNAEIAPARGLNVLHQQTGVLALLSERAPGN